MIEEARGNIDYEECRGRTDDGACAGIMQHRSGVAACYRRLG